MQEMSNWAVACYWSVGIFITLNFFFSIAVTIGGFFDLVHLLKSLKESEVEETDDGRVLST